MQNPFKRPMGQGLIEDPEGDNDPRNIFYDDIAPLGGEEQLPESVDVLEEDVPNLSQGATTACTCFSTVHSFYAQSGILLSPRYAFSKIKTDKAYRSSQLSWGAYMVDSLKLLVNEGVPVFDSQYDEADVESDVAYIKPKTAQELIKGGRFVYATRGNDNAQKWQQLKRYLAFEHKPVKVGITWRGSFNSASKGVVPAVEPTRGSYGHDMLAVAYKTIIKDGKGEEYVGFENSYGPKWGDRGRVWLPIRFTQLSSAIAYIAPDDVVKHDIKAPGEKPVVRDLFKEKSVAAELRRAIDDTFPTVGEAVANANNINARSIAGRNWLVLVPAVTYHGWTVTDVKNWLYAQSRGKKTTAAYKLDFTKPKRVR